MTPTICSPIHIPYTRPLALYAVLVLALRLPLPLYSEVAPPPQLPRVATIHGEIIPKQLRVRPFAAFLELDTLLFHRLPK